VQAYTSALARFSSIISQETASSHLERASAAIVANAFDLACDTNSGHLITM
jgi:hypothetical protein